MAGSSFGTLFRITTWGESHGPALGVVVDGCPAGLPLTAEDFAPLMNRRRPNASAMSTMRKEADAVEILSGVFEGMTTGTPISLLIRNTDQHSSDYGNLAFTMRPGHADYGFETKYGHRDHRGGGRSSGRETAARVAAGVIAEKVLATLGISFETCVTSIGGVPFEEAADLVKKTREACDSIGSEVRCVVHGVPAGIGDPVFDKLDAKLAEAMFSIGAIKAFQIGDGCKVAVMKGSENNDAFRMEDGKVVTKTNHAGGILGGFSNGSDLVLTASFKPTPSIALEQETVTKDGQEVPLVIHGRHDPVIGPRAAVVVEAMAAIVILDSMMMNMSARLSSLSDFYNGSQPK